MNFEQKYLKYKMKYISLKRYILSQSNNLKAYQIGGELFVTNEIIYKDKEMKLPLIKNDRLIHLPTLSRGNFAQSIPWEKKNIVKVFMFKDSNNLDIIDDTINKFMLENEYDKLHPKISIEQNKPSTPPTKKPIKRPPFIPHVHEKVVDSGILPRFGLHTEFSDLI
jgi:hypothetical protein